MTQPIISLLDTYEKARITNDAAWKVAADEADSDEAQAAYTQAQQAEEAALGACVTDLLRLDPRLNHNVARALVLMRREQIRSIYA